MKSKQLLKRIIEKRFKGAFETDELADQCAQEVVDLTLLDETNEEEILRLAEKMDSREALQQFLYKIFQDSLVKACDDEKYLSVVLRAIKEAYGVSFQRRLDLDCNYYLRYLTELGPDKIMLTDKCYLPVRTKFLRHMPPEDRYYVKLEENPKRGKYMFEDEFVFGRKQWPETGPYVSSQVARVRRDGDKLYVKVLSKTNPVTVAGEVVQPGEEVMIFPGDIVEQSNFHFKIFKLNPIKTPPYSKLPPENGAEVDIMDLSTEEFEDRFKKFRSDESSESSSGPIFPEIGLMVGDTWMEPFNPATNVKYDVPVTEITRLIKNRAMPVNISQWEDLKFQGNQTKKRVYLIPRNNRVELQVNANNVFLRTGKDWRPLQMGEKYLVEIDSQIKIHPELAFTLRQE